MALVAVLILYPPERAAAPARPLRMVVLYTLGMVALLTAGWQADLLGAGAVSAEAARTTTALAVLGFALLLAAPPFHLWFPSTAGHSHPYSLAFVILISQAGALFTVFRFFDAYAWLRQNAMLFVAARWVGIGIAAFRLGVGPVPTQPGAYRRLCRAWPTRRSSCSRSRRRALGGTNSPSASRRRAVVRLAVWAIGASVLQNGGAGDTAEELSGIAYRAPLPTVTVLVGLLSIAGFPLTAGFPGRWAVMAGGGPAAFAVVGTFGAVSLAAVRWTSTVLRSPRAGGVPARSSSGSSSARGSSCACCSGCFLNCCILGSWAR